MIIKYIQRQPPEVFCKKGVLKNFTKFTGKHLCQSLFFNKVAEYRCFPVKIFQNTFFYRTPPGDCFCIMHFRRCTFNLFNNPCLERKGNQGNCMFKQFVFMSIFRNIYLTLILALIFVTTFSLLILFSSYF